MFNKIMMISVMGILLLSAATATAHPGRTNSEGCHNDRKNCTYHCH